MSPNPPNDALRPEHSAENHERSDANQPGSGPRKWVNVPDEIPQWLSKRVEFSVPLWILAITTIILTILVFD